MLKAPSPLCYDGRKTAIIMDVGLVLHKTERPDVKGPRPCAVVAADRTCLAILPAANAPAEDRQSLPRLSEHPPITEVKPWLPAPF